MDRMRTPVAVELGDRRALQVDSDDHLLAVLRELIKKDPSVYIRLQSAAVIRDLGPRQKF